MKKEQEIVEQWKLIHKIYNDKKGMFDWEYLKQAIELLIDMKKDISFYNFKKNLDKE